MSFGVHFWEGLCFAIFVVITYQPIKKALSEQLDKYSNSIKQLITEAENLRIDAEKIFDYYTKKHKSFEDQLAVMAKHMQDHVKLIKQGASEILEEKIKVKRRMHEEKLALYIKEEKKRVREAIIQKAVTLANFYMQDITTPSVTKQDVTDMLNSMRDKSITFH